MALFNWFTKKSDSSRKVVSRSADQKASRSHGAAPPTTTPLTPPAHLRPPADPTNRSEQRKAKRHVRREQLYSAIRQAMTRAGVLSACYKFKVLSLDQRGDEFLVMMEVQPSMGLQEEKMLESEALVMQIAKAQFAILVTAVYWRMDTAAVPGDAKHESQALTPAVPAPGIAAAAVPDASVKKFATARFEPIDIHEMGAFKRALATAAVQSPLANDWANTMSTTPSPQTSTEPATNSAAKSRSPLQSYTLLTGFEDTEMPESAALPALSTTQYGDLN